MPHDAPSGHGFPRRPNGDGYGSTLRGVHSARLSSGQRRILASAHVQHVKCWFCVGLDLVEIPTDENSGSIQCQQDMLGHIVLDWTEHTSTLPALLHEIRQGVQLGHSTLGDGVAPEAGFALLCHRTEPEALVTRVAELSSVMPLVPILGVVAELRGRGPVRALAAKSQCLMAGADACVWLPDDRAQLLPQAIALARRARANASCEGLDADPELRLNDAEFRIGIEGSVMQLTPTEFRMVRHLVIREGIWVKASELAIHGGLPLQPGSPNVRWHIHQARRRLGAHAWMLHGSRPSGYMFRRSSCGGHHCLGTRIRGGSELTEATVKHEVRVVHQRTGSRGGHSHDIDEGGR